MLPTTVHALHVHPAQMRTRVQVGELAKLAVQVSRGLDATLPLLLRPDGQGGFVVISGHRRWLALMIAFLAQTDLSQEPVPEGEGAVEFMQAAIERLCPVQDGFVQLSEKLYADLVAQVPETLTVPFQLWDGPPADEVLLLIKANTGSEEPDLVGQARAYKAALDAGASYDQLAQVTGQAGGRLQAMVALLSLPCIFQELVNDGLLELSVVMDVFPLTEVQLQALAKALHAEVRLDRLEGDTQRDYTGKVRNAATFMQSGPQIPKQAQTEPVAVNFAAAVQGLWLEADVTLPAALYHAIALHTLHGRRVTGLNGAMEVLATLPQLQDRFEFIEKSWGGQGAVLTNEAIRALLPDHRCTNCAFLDLPAEYLKKELPFPCRRGGAGPCLNWAKKRKKFWYRTPWEWNRGGKVVRTLKELEEAWRRQQEWESRPRAESSTLSGSVESVEQLREHIRIYMAEHLTGRFDLAHPWATACARCAHHLDKSPVKADPEAPHCVWAKGKRRLQFRAFIPYNTDGTPASENIIPFCMQFAPDQAWAHVVPEADTPLPYEREFSLRLLEALASDTNRNVYSTDCRAALQFLTGRPLKASANHRQTFADRLKEEAPTLSDGQVWTLLQWVLLEWERVRGSGTGQMVPTQAGLVKANVVYFSTVMAGGVMEKVWDDDEPEEDFED